MGEDYAHEHLPHVVHYGPTYHHKLYLGYVVVEHGD
jgi:hypothetical protein